MIKIHESGNNTEDYNININEISNWKEFVEFLYDGVDLNRNDAFLEFRIRPQGSNDFPQEFHNLNDGVPEIPNFIGDIYFGVGIRKNKSGKKEDVLCCTCLWGDLDVGKSITEEEAYLRMVKEPQPTIVIQSGHGWHLYYKLKEPFYFRSDDDIDYFESILKGFQNSIQSDNVHDIGRVLRVPGSSNFKNIESITECKIVEACPSHVYDLKEFEKFIVSESEPSIDKKIKKVALDCSRESVNIDELAIPENLKEKIRHQGVEVGYRSEYDFHIVCELIRNGVDDQTIADIALDPANSFSEKAQSKGKYDIAYLKTTIEKAHKQVGPIVSSDEIDLTTYKFDDLGNSRLFVDLYHSDMRYCTNLKCWLVWDGRRWVVDEASEFALEKAKELVENMGIAGESIADPNRKKEFDAHVKRSSNERSLNAIPRLSKPDPKIKIDFNRLDYDNYLINCKNGTLNLKTGELNPHCKKDFITKIINVNYDPNAKCPKWDAFLKKIFDGNKDIIEFVQKVFGYTLTGDISEQYLFFCIGKGANGKSVMLETFSDILGEDYAKMTVTETLMKGRSLGASPDITRLEKVRMVNLNELDNGNKMAGNLIKQLTGEDKISARNLYESYGQFDPKFKIFIRANHPPGIDFEDDALWRRFVVIPFDVTIPKDERNRNLKKDMLQEASGILTWAVEGCKKWMDENGLTIPDEIKEAKEKMKYGSDEIHHFLTECTIEENGKKVKADTIYRVYENWCDNNKKAPMSNTAFGKGLKQKLKSSRQADGVYYLDKSIKNGKSIAQFN